MSSRACRALASPLVVESGATESQATLTETVARSEAEANVPCARQELPRYVSALDNPDDIFHDCEDPEDLGAGSMACVAPWKGATAREPKVCFFVTQMSISRPRARCWSLKRCHARHATTMAQAQDS